MGHSYSDLGKPPFACDSMTTPDRPPCLVCDGAGFVGQFNDPNSTCENCGGTGREPATDRPPPLDPARDEQLAKMRAVFDHHPGSLEIHRDLMDAGLTGLAWRVFDILAATRDLADELATTLEKHMGIQNGPPVGADYRTWREAMDASVAALSRYRAAGRGTEGGGKR